MADRQSQPASGSHENGHEQPPLPPGEVGELIERLIGPSEAVEEEKPPAGAVSSDAGLARLLGDARSSFEDAWRAAATGAPPPRLETFIQTALEPIAAVVFRQMLTLELEYRARAGEELSAEEYHSRFPEHRHIVTHVFSGQAPSPRRAIPSSRASVGSRRREKRTGAYQKRNATQDGVPAARSGSREVARTLPPCAPGGSPLPLPELPGFEVIAEIGRGGMGVVYKARQTQLNRLVALKMILAGLHAGPRELARFRVEAEAIARLQHPNIVQVFEIGEHNGQPFCVLEFIDGPSLEEELADRPKPFRQSARLVETLARAIHAAHRRGIVHRDLKPANVLMASDETPKITDFGLAKLLDSDLAHTSSDAVLGTPSYMAPEQAEGKSKVVGPAADIYAVGAILYEMLTGRPPFLGPTPLDTIVQVSSQEVLPPRRLRTTVPRDLETIVMKCLQKSPENRYRTARSLADDLRRFLNHEPIRARPVRVWDAALKWGQRNPVVAALIGIMATAFLLGVVRGCW